MGIVDARIGSGVELVPLRRYPDVLIPSGGREHWRDWFGIRGLAVGHLAGVPGVTRLIDGSAIFHRSHLPLVAADLAKTIRPGDHAVGGFEDGTIARPHQVFGACWLKARAGAVLADGMRVGKTCQVILAHDEASGPLVVSAPLNTRRVWLRWMAKRWPGVTPCVVEGLSPSAEMKKAPLVFVHHEILGAHQALGNWRPGTLALDEAHKFSNPKSIRTQGFALLAVNAQKVIALTGTPLWNRPTGLYPILSAISPAAWGGWKDFAVRYCDGKPGPWGMIAEGASHVEEFKLRLFEVMLRREWGDAGLEAPAVDRAIITVPISKAEGYEIDKLAEEMRSEGKRRVPAAELGRLRYILGRLKVNAAITASKALEPGTHHVIWAWHREIAKTLAERLGGRLVTGDTPATRREAIFDKWEAEGGPLVLTMAVGEVGIDLSAAKVAIFAELDWTPATIAQAEMRTFAPDRPMRVMYLAADHRSDRAIVKALGKKLDLAKIFGVPAADGAIDVIGQAFNWDVQGEADLNRLARELTGGGAA